MKIAIILLLVGFNFFACNFGSLSQIQKPGSETIATSPTPNANGCVEANFKPKKEGEIAAMTPRQLLDEQVKTKIYMDTFRSLAEWTDYGILIDKYIRKSGADMLPVLTEYVNSYDVKNVSECEAMRFSVASREGDDIDRFVFRLRGSNEGQLTLASLERAVGQMKDAGFDDMTRDYDDNRRFRIDERHLRYLKGVNEVDDAVQDTFWVNRKMMMSDDELLEFSNFLVSRDPTYPAWSDMEWFKDYSRVNEAGSPAQVLVFKKPERFYEAYLEFKKRKGTK